MQQTLHCQQLPKKIHVSHPILQLQANATKMLHCELQEKWNYPLLFAMLRDKLLHVTRQSQLATQFCLRAKQHVLHLREISRWRAQTCDTRSVTFNAFQLSLLQGKLPHVTWPLGTDNFICEGGGGGGEIPQKCLPKLKIMVHSKPRQINILQSLYCKKIQAENGCQTPFPQK